MFWLIFALKLFSCLVLGIVASLLILQIVYVVVYTIALMKFISQNNRLPEHLSNFSVHPCTKGKQREKKADVTNYTYAIKHCIRKSFNFGDIFGIIRTGVYRPSEMEYLDTHHNNRRKEDDKESIISMANSPFPNVSEEFFHSGANVSQEDNACQPKTNGTTSCRDCNLGKADYPLENGSRWDDVLRITQLVREKEAPAKNPNGFSRSSLTLGEEKKKNR